MNCTVAGIFSTKAVKFLSFNSNAHKEVLHDACELVSKQLTELLAALLRKEIDVEVKTSRWVMNCKEAADSMVIYDPSLTANQRQ